MLRKKNSSKHVQDSKAKDTWIWLQVSGVIDIDDFSAFYELV